MSGSRRELSLRTPRVWAGFPAVRCEPLQNRRDADETTQLSTKITDIAAPTANGNAPDSWAFPAAVMPGYAQIWPHLGRLPSYSGSATLNTLRSSFSHAEREEEMGSATYTHICIDTIHHWLPSSAHRHSTRCKTASRNQHTHLSEVRENFELRPSHRVGIR